MKFLYLICLIALLMNASLTMITHMRKEKNCDSDIKME